MAEPRHPIATGRQGLLAAVFMPALVGVAWWKALQFDPYTMSFFTKTYFEPTPSMPGDFRMFGWVVIGLGGLVLAALANGLLRGRVALKEIWLTSLWALEVIAFGGAFFVTAERAEQAISARENRL